MGRGILNHGDHATDHDVACLVSCLLGVFDRQSRANRAVRLSDEKNHSKEGSVNPAFQPLQMLRGLPPLTCNS